MSIPAVRFDLSPAGLLKTHEIPLMILGSPKIEGCGVVFDGIQDGLIYRKTILPGAGNFEIEVQICPESIGSREQRFFHIQDDKSEGRFLLELRITPGGQWFADTFFMYQDRFVILQDNSFLHSCDSWHTYRVVYDGECISNWIDFQFQESASFPDAHLPETGITSIGIRGNRLYPFCGIIGDIHLSTQ